MTTGTTPPMPTSRPLRRGLPRWAIIGIVAGAVLFLCCLGGVAVALVSSDDEPEAPASTPPSPSALGSPTASLEPQLTEGPSPEPEPSPTSEPPPTEEPLVAIPDDLVGQNAAVAEDELERLGFEDIQFGSADPDDTVVILPQNWTVVDVAPAPGSDVPPDSTVVLICTKQ